MDFIQVIKCHRYTQLCSPSFLFRLSQFFLFSLHISWISRCISTNLQTSQLGNLRSTSKSGHCKPNEPTFQAFLSVFPAIEGYSLFFSLVSPWWLLRTSFLLLLLFVICCHCYCCLLICNSWPDRPALVHMLASCLGSRSQKALPGQVNVRHTKEVRYTQNIHSLCSFPHATSWPLPTYWLYF